MPPQTSDSIIHNRVPGPTLGIAGVGLIGGSIAAAAKSRGLFGRIIGFGRSRNRLEAAQATGLIDAVATDENDFQSVDLFVSCVPVEAIAESLLSAARHMRPGSVLTDAGSVKGIICSAVGSEPAPGVHYVPAHPLAGSEKGGHEHADANLFVGRTCILCPTESSSAAAQNRVREFWENLGSLIEVLTPEHHDALLARTSHLPHLAAAAVATQLPPGAEQLAAGGFRDTTRIAGGNPELWAGILLANGPAVGAALEELIVTCQEMRDALARSDRPQLTALLAEAKSRRDAFAEFGRAGP